MFAAAASAAPASSFPSMSSTDGHAAGLSSGRQSPEGHTERLPFVELRENEYHLQPSKQPAADACDCAFSPETDPIEAACGPACINRQLCMECKPSRSPDTRSRSLALALSLALNRSPSTTIPSLPLSLSHLPLLPSVCPVLQFLYALFPSASVASGRTSIGVELDGGARLCYDCAARLHCAIWGPHVPRCMRCIPMHCFCAAIMAAKNDQLVKLDF